MERRRGFELERFGCHTKPPSYWRVSSFVTWRLGVSTKKNTVLAPYSCSGVRRYSCSKGMTIDRCLTERGSVGRDDHHGRSRRVGTPILRLPAVQFHKHRDHRNQQEDHAQQQHDGVDAWRLLSIFSRG